jgi:hypothetical protein
MMLIARDQNPQLCTDIVPSMRVRRDAQLFTHRSSYSVHTWVKRPPAGALRRI